ncbi:MAG: hypothetical protein A2Z25_13810 [Planctomycetes bacterium RBG_16_55_9]|nr:MAG: hypothetical protein A2Z25_13810 [Planctomycetes bacterium RBG_16_55_9]
MFKPFFCLTSLFLMFGLAGGASAGLLAHWQFDDGSGTTAQDSSGNGHAGALRGDPTWVAGVIGSGALSLDGSDGLVEVGHDESLSLTNALSITAWVKLNDLGTYYFLLCKQPSGTARDNYPGNYEFRTEITSGALQFGHQQTEAEQYTFYTSTAHIAAGQWRHVAVSVTKGGLVEFYVDGVAAGSSAQTTNFGVLNTQPVRIGGRKDGYSFFNGLLDDVYLYDQALSAGQVQKQFEGVPPTFTVARNPSPADGAVHKDTWITLGWSPGDAAASHDVYMGDNFNDVNDGAAGAFRGNQATTFFVAGFPGFAYPDGLAPGTRYYWRIDEVEADGTTVHKGNIWSFSVPPRTAYDPIPADGAEVADPNAVTLSWTPGFGSKLHSVFFGDDFDVVNAAVGGPPQGLTNYNPGPLELGKVYHWRIDEFDGAQTYKGNVWSFAMPGAAGNPQPANGAGDVGMNAVLSWSPADNAASHRIYLGTDEQAVRNADTGSPEYKGSVTLGAESYVAGLLEPDTGYFWRVDKVDGQGNAAKGLVWSFTTGAFLLVDDFEGYTDDDAAGQAIWQSWIDGFGVADNGSQVGNVMPPYAEQVIVHGGSQSMPLIYDNTAGVTNSETAMTLTGVRDWTAGGVDTLVIWFKGRVDNADEPLYAGIANTGGALAVVVHADVSAARIRGWTKWAIPLQSFSNQGIDLTSVDKIAIGLGTRGNPAASGGAGKMHFDDISLY